MKRGGGGGGRRGYLVGEDPRRGEKQGALDRTRPAGSPEESGTGEQLRKMPLEKIVSGLTGEQAGGVAREANIARQSEAIQAERKAAKPARDVFVRRILYVREAEDCLIDAVIEWGEGCGRVCGL